MNRQHEVGVERLCEVGGLVAVHHDATADVGEEERHLQFVEAVECVGVTGPEDGPPPDREQERTAEAAWMGDVAVSVGVRAVGSVVGGQRPEVDLADVADGEVVLLADADDLVREIVDRRHVTVDVARVDGLEGDDGGALFRDALDAVVVVVVVVRDTDEVAVPGVVVVEHPVPAGVEVGDETVGRFDADGRVTEPGHRESVVFDRHT